MTSVSTIHLAIAEAKLPVPAESLANVPRLAVSRLSQPSKDNRGLAEIAGLVRAILIWELIGSCTVQQASVFRHAGALADDE